MTVSLCKHSFPIQPPHGSIAQPGDCTGCGTSWGAVQAELARQEHLLILGTARDGVCPECTRTRRLFRFQPPEQPWHEFGTEMPVSFLCMDCWNAASNARNEAVAALFAAV